jgi:uncharacterized protein
MRKYRHFLRFTVFALLAAAAALLTVNTASASSSASGIFDEADLLTDEEESKLETVIDSYTDRYDCDIAVVTTSDAEGLTAQEYADQYAEDIGQSMSSDGRAGILFLIDMDNRYIHIATQGQAIGYYSDDRINSILDDCYNKIVEEDYYGACRCFLKGVYSYMGRSVSQGARMGLSGILIRLAIALAAGGGITAAMAARSGGRVTDSASDYTDQNQSSLTGRQDVFVNRTVTHHVIVHDDNSRGGGGGGGGSSHISSGGGMHGGGGRSF